jgi:hypothetical protein
MRRVAVALAVVVLAAACGGDRPPSSGGPPADPRGPITVQRTGGIAGVQDEVTVQPDGSWGRTGTTAGTSGRLSADRNATLTRLAADPELRVEAARTTPDDGCADAFEYTLSVGDLRVEWTDCGATRPPVASRIARFLLEGSNSR